MALGILQNGIIQRHTDGQTTLLRPGKNGGTSVETEVPEEIADAFRLVTGDIVEGTVLDGFLTQVTRINGLEGEEAEERPFPRSRRSSAERSSPDRLITMATSARDTTGRMIDFAAPLGLGVMGIVRGVHGSGLTRTLRAVLDGIVTVAPDCVVMVFLLRARSEEITDWRRRFPDADVVCTSPFDNTPAEIVRLADLLLEAAQRQTELGKDVVLLVDSLTGLWAAMLEVEEADAQMQADQSQARQRMREWVQKAGCFHNEGPLGGSLGGSLTLLGTVWHQKVDAEQEEEQETHPHLRLLEHLLPETSWQVVLSDILTEVRFYPAIDVKQCLSHDEERLLPAEMYDILLTARSTLPRHDPITCYRRLMEALDTSETMTALLENLIAGEER